MSTTLKTNVYQKAIPIVRKPEVLIAVRELIRTHPEKFYWNTYLTNYDCGFVPIGDALNDCGTVGCIAGWMCVLAYPDRLVVDWVAKAIESANMFIKDWEPCESEMLLRAFLFTPWEFVDKNDKTLGTLDTRTNIPEALRRIDWLLQGKDVFEYVIPTGKRKELGRSRTIDLFMHMGKGISKYMAPIFFLMLCLFGSTASAQNRCSQGQCTYSQAAAYTKLVHKYGAAKAAKIAAKPNPAVAARNAFYAKQIQMRAYYVNRQQMLRIRYLQSIHRL